MTDLFPNLRAAIQADRARLLEALAVLDRTLAALDAVQSAAVPGIPVAGALDATVRANVVRPLGKPLGARPPRKTAKAARPAPTTDERGRERPAPFVARDEALLAQARKGPQEFAAMLAAMPHEPGQTADQRKTACSNALFRLKARKRLTTDAEGRYVIA